MRNPLDVNVSRGDTGVDHSQTSIDNSSRVNKTKDDHSINTSTVADNSSRNTSINTDSSDRRRESSWRWVWSWANFRVGDIHLGGATTLGIVGVLAIVAVVAIFAMARLAPAPQTASAEPAGELSPAIGPPPDGMVSVPPNHAAPGQASITTRFAIGRAETTTAQFAAFVSFNPQWQRDRLAPSAHDGDYLKDWAGAKPSPDLAGKPVAYVTWGAADAFCSAQGNRLPTEQEWDYAARVEPAGLGNMAGSLWEWTSTEAPRAASTRYVVRGGGWQDPPGLAGVEARQFLAPTVTAPDLGFRCVR